MWDRGCILNSSYILPTATEANGAILAFVSGQSQPNIFDMTWTMTSEDAIAIRRWAEYTNETLYGYFFTLVHWL